MNREDNLKQQSTLSPLLEQYFLKKKEYSDYLILVQVGKFYEAYGQDALLLGEKLGLKITKKGDIPMSGVPIDTLETYASLLLQKNIKIVCINQDKNKQLENNLVVRKVAAIITPGLNYFNTQHQPNYLLTLKMSHQKGKTERIYLAFIDLTVGDLYTEKLNRNDLVAFLGKIQPVEILVCGSDLQRAKELIVSEDRITVIPEEAFNEACLNLLTTSLKVQEIPKPQTKLIGSIVWYCFKNQFKNLTHIKYCGLFNCSKFLKLENFTIANLELQEPLRPSGRTLFEVLDKTKTPMGRRELKQRLLFPSCDKQVITDRLNWVEFFKDQKRLSEQLQELLTSVGDLSRLSNKASWEAQNPRFILSLAESLTQVNNIKNLLRTSGVSGILIHQLSQSLSTCSEFRSQVFNTLEAQNPFESGAWIKVGVCKQLDQLKSAGVVEKREQLMRELTKQLGFRPKLQQAKDGWVCEFTYYQSKKLNSEWQVHSSSKKKIKYSHPLLQKFDAWYQTKGQRITEQIERLEFREYLKLVDQAARIREKVQRTAIQLANIDVSVALGITAQVYNYTRPVITDQKHFLIKGARHPVLEQQVTYRANDCFLGNKTEEFKNVSEQIMLITGANMGGKSSFVRQIALISIMAQMGSFVPAKQASLGILDSLFVRVGGFDNLALNQSTFMVEMSEIAAILNNLTPRSLVVLDEIGRGTSFVDGFALGCSILEHLHNHKFTPYVLCTTHFSELTQIANHLSRCQNFMMQSSIQKDKVYHSYLLSQGVCKNSLGIETAQAAKIPENVIERAKELRDKLHPTSFKKIFL